MVVRVSHALFRTERDVPSDAHLVSHQLLLKAGLVRPVASGIYTLAPLALRALDRIAGMARDEMNRVGAQEILLPTTLPAALWEQSGRYAQVDATLARWQDRNHTPMVLAMTHEEAAVDTIRHFVSSYRQLPIIVYQIQTKFRDEIRPRGGLVRLREFVMKDAYSFHADQANLDQFYAQMITAYERFYTRTGVPILTVEADTGMMGGGVSHEFMLLTEGGEDTLIRCSACTYVANREVAISAPSAIAPGTSPDWSFWTGSNGNPIAVGVPPGTDVSSVKVARAVGILDAWEIDSNEQQPARGPDESDENLRVVLDARLVDTVLHSATPIRADVSAVHAGAPCARCSAPLEAVRGIEVGNTFQLGTYYTVPMEALFTTRDGHRRPFLMGCYGIGLSRMLAAVIEANYDERGIVWPPSVAPYPLHLVTVGVDPAVTDAAERLYAALGPEQVFFDDRDVPAGVKFHDADLLGLPHRLTLSPKTLAIQSVEWKNRKTGESGLVTLNTLGQWLEKIGS